MPEKIAIIKDIRNTTDFESNSKSTLEATAINKTPKKLIK